jgi:hypothetical protein
LKSRSPWLKDGDSNTSFFHKQTQQRIKEKYSHKNTSNKWEAVLESFNQIKATTSQHFENFKLKDLQEDDDFATQEMLQNIPQSISEEDNVSLVKEITEEEIYQAIWSFEQDKAPGPDGFSIIFFKHFWELIKFELR